MPSIALKSRTCSRKSGAARTLRENSALPESAIEALLEKLRTEHAQAAWVEFLAHYSDQIYKTARLTTGDGETAADCYLYICQKLCQENCKRLLRFKPGGPAKFETWLSVVARNLCFDWFRSRYGRRRPFRSVDRLPHLENEVFRLHMQQGMSLEETLSQLAPRNPDATWEAVEAADARIQQALSSRQRWFLGQHTAAREIEPVGADEEEGAKFEIEDSRPSPELELLAQQEKRELAAAVAKLEPAERLLIRLRFEEELSLAEIARLTEAGDAQRTYYRMNLVLAKLRRSLGQKALKK